MHLFLSWVSTEVSTCVYLIYDKRACLKVRPVHNWGTALRNAILRMVVPCNEPDLMSMWLKFDVHYFTIHFKYIQFYYFIYRTLQSTGPPKHNIWITTGYSSIQSYTLWSFLHVFVQRIHPIITLKHTDSSQMPSSNVISYKLVICMTHKVGYFFVLMCFRWNFSFVLCTHTYNSTPSHTNLSNKTVYYKWQVAIHHSH